MPKKPSIWTATLILSGSLLPAATAMPLQDTAAEAAEFARFQQQQQTEFEQFEQQHWQQFEQFVEQWRQAEQAYKHQLSKTWQQPQLSDRTRYVQYSSDQRERTVVDYQHNTITLEVQGQVDKPQMVERIRQRLQQLQRTTVTDAVRSDPVIQQLPETVKQQLQVTDATPLLEPNTDPAAVAEPAAENSTSSASTSKITVKLPDSSADARVKRVLPSVRVYAQKHGLSVPLVLAIIHTESSFNPMARSHIPAFGLMQIVPTSAGRDISDYLYGKQQLFSPGYLFDPDNNIEAGSVYYYLLNRRYFKQVRNDEVRELLSIAAYNTGPGNVANTFGRDYSLQQASAAANRMDQQQAYQHLMTHLPAQETKDYLQKILRRQTHYQQLMETL